MELILFDNFSKRINSTKRPVDSAGLLVDVKLKQQTSKESPTFILNGPIKWDVNYCKWNGHYYYVNDIRVGINNMYEIECTQDLLASHKDVILSNNAFVEYSSSNYDEKINDPRMTSSGQSICRNSAITKIVESNTGGFIVQTVGNNPAAILGGVNVYYLTSNNLNSLAKWLGNADLQSILSEQYANAMEQIISIQWTPFEYEGAETELFIGKINTGIICYGLSATGKYKTEYKTINLGKNMWLGDYRDTNNWSDLKLHLPFVGWVNLPIELCRTVNTFYVNIVRDVLGGTIHYEIDFASYHNEYTADCTATIPLTSIHSNRFAVLSGYMSAGMELIGGIASAGVGNAVGAIGGVVSGIADITKTTYTKDHYDVTVKGASGNLSTVAAVLSSNPASYLRGIQIRQIFTDPTELESGALMGRPLFKTVLLNSLTGYVKCANTSIDIDGMANDKVQVNQFINSGFYIE